MLIGIQATNAVNKVMLTHQIEDDQLQTVLALAKTVEMRDSHLSGHSEKIAYLSEQVARRLGCSKKEFGRSAGPPCCMILGNWNP